MRFSILVPGGFRPPWITPNVDYFPLLYWPKHLADENKHINKIKTERRESKHINKIKTCAAEKHINKIKKYVFILLICYFFYFINMFLIFLY